MRYHNITKDDMLNGDGLRVVLWVSGCNHYCRDCQNPITWDVTGGLPFGEAEKQELFDELEKSYVSGITYSGGDPLHPANRAETAALIREIHERFPRKTQWLYTGYLWEDICRWDGIDLLNVVVDGRFLTDERDTKLKWRGSPNQRVINVQETLKQGSIVLHCD